MTELHDHLTKFDESDAIRRLNRQIDVHEKYLDKQSYLSGIVSLAWGGDQAGLQELKDLRDSIDKAEKEGNKAEVTRLAREADKAARQDLETLRKHEDYSGYITGGIKTAGMFMRGMPAISVCIGAYGLDQARRGDSFRDNLKDFTLGGTKGAAINWTMHKVTATQASPFMKGATLAFSANVLDNVLNRHNYQGSDFGSLGAGFARGLGRSLDPKVLATEGLVFSLGLGMVGKGDAIANGALRKSALASTMLTGTAFGLSSGAVSEIVRQEEAGEKFDLGKIIKSSLIHGAIDTVAAAPGGMQARSAMLRSRESLTTRADSPLYEASGERAPVREFSITSGERALSAFFRGETSNSGLIKVREMMNGRPGRERTLFAQHLEGGQKLEASTANRAELLATCNPKDLPAVERARHVFPEAADKVYMALSRGRLRLSASEAALNAGEGRVLALGGEKGRRVSDMLEQHGHADFAEVIAEHPRFRRLKATRWLGEGNESVAVEVAPAPGMPEGAALKVTLPEGGWQHQWGKRPFDAKMFGRMEEVEANGISANVYLQEVVEFRSKYEPEDVNRFMRKVEKAGLEFVDPGADPTKQIGFSKLTGELVLIDYAAVDKAGSNRTHQEIIGGRERVEAEYEAENARIRNGEAEPSEPMEAMETIDIAAQIRRQDALSDKSISESRRAILSRLVLGESVQDAAIFRAAELGDFSPEGMKRITQEVKEVRTWAIKNNLLSRDGY